MNKLTVISAALLFAGLTSLAQAQDTGAISKTRAQVVAELQQARDSGELAATNNEIGVDGYQAASRKTATAYAAKPAVTTVPGQSRAEVVAELKRARATGELDAIQSEGGPSNYPVAVGRVDGSTPVLAGKPRNAQ